MTKKLNKVDHLASSLIKARKRNNRILKSNQNKSTKATTTWTNVRQELFTRNANVIKGTFNYCRNSQGVLSNARDYSFSKVLYLEREEKDNWPIKLRQRRDVILLKITFPRPLKKMADKRRKNSRKQSKLSNVETNFLTELYWAGNWLTTRAKSNIMKPHWQPLDFLKLSLEKKIPRWPLRNKLMLQIGIEKSHIKSIE